MYIWITIFVAFVNCIYIYIQMITLQIYIYYRDYLCDFFLHCVLLYTVYKIVALSLPLFLAVYLFLNNFCCLFLRQTSAISLGSLSLMSVCFFMFVCVCVCVRINNYYFNNIYIFFSAPDRFHLRLLLLRCFVA